MHRLQPFKLGFTQLSYWFICPHCILTQRKDESRSMARKVAEELDAEYWETSSKTGKHIRTIPIRIFEGFKFCCFVDISWQVTKS